MAIVRDRRTGKDRRVEDIEVEEERRLIQRRQGDPSRRQLMDRRQANVPVENDRRQSSRRTADIEAISTDGVAVPDWMGDVLSEAAKRREEMPAFTPPPVKPAEKDPLRYEEEMSKQARMGDWILVAFVFVCVAALITVMATVL